MSTLTLLLPFAHAGHVLVTLPIYLGPVILLVLGLKVADARDKRKKANRGR
ncbi:MAG TPA: hypothetical protein VF752_08025 [Thermoleophilaceae bacterium]